MRSKFLYCAIGLLFAFAPAAHADDVEDAKRALEKIDSLLSDTKGYLAVYTDVADAGMNPLEHYHVYGWTEGRDPSPQFDTKGYLTTNTDVADAHIDPLTHYLQHGSHELRTIVNDGQLS